MDTGKRPPAPSSEPALSPREGRRLPRQLRARHVHRQAARVAGGLAGGEFEELLRRIDQGPVHPGNEVEIFTHGGDAFAAMRRAIAGARREVLLESYIWRDDEVGRAFLEDLAGAAGRGVTVRVVADALGSAETGPGFWRSMRERGIEAHLFHPLFPYIWAQAYRDHRKILVVDQGQAFTGGMNIGREYGSLARGGGGSWRDTHLRARGPVAWEMALVFSESWLRAGGAPFPIAVTEADASAGEARILVLDSRPNRGHAEAAAVLAAIVGAARRSVWITNAYFAPRRIAIDILGRAAERGVDVRLLLPGITDVPLVRHAGHGYFAALLERGVRVFEYRGALLHAKSMVADGAVAIVGSTNLDFRSFQFNAECNLVILDERAGTTLETAFLRDLEQAEEIHLPAWNRRPLLHRLGDRCARLLSPLL